MSVKNNVHNTNNFYNKPVEVQGVDAFPGKPTLPDILTKSFLYKKEKMAAWAASTRCLSETVTYKIHNACEINVFFTR